MNKLTRREREQQNTIETVISTAEELFCSQGYDNTSMDDIAKASEYTKRTIYRYFINKEDLFFAAALKGYRQLICMIGENNEYLSGFNKIQSAYYAFFEFYKQFPQSFKLITMSGIVKSVSANSETPYMHEFMKSDKQLFESIVNMFMIGKADNSIRADVNLQMLAFSSVFMAVGFFQMISLYGNTYTNHFGMDEDLFIKFSIDIMLDTFRNKEK